MIKHIEIVYRKGDQILVWMPGRVSAAAVKIRFQTDFAPIAVDAQIGAASLSGAHMKDHVGGIIPAKVVTIHAIAFSESVDHDRFFIKSREIALVDPHLVPILESRIDEPVS